MIEKNDLSEMSKVISVSPKLIEIEVFDLHSYHKDLDEPLKIGSYIQISDTRDSAEPLIAIVTGFRVQDNVPPVTDLDPYKSGYSTEIREPRFVVSLQPLGRLRNKVFTRGANEISIPPKFISVASDGVLGNIYSESAVKAPLCFGCLAQESSVQVNIDGDKFFGKHIGIVGSTGSGKSSTVAAILQQGIERSDSQVHAGLKNNSHILIFDLHGEYASAFPDAKVLSVDNIVLPYWLMNSEELEETFIESREQNSHNQISQFRRAVIENKKRHNPKHPDLSYDDPFYFSLNEVLNFLKNLNSEMIGKAEGDGNRPKLSNGELIGSRNHRYFEEVLDFAPSSASKADKTTKGPFNGEFDRFIMRLEAKILDDRLNFLLRPKLRSGEPKTPDLPEIFEQLLGYCGDGVNVAVLDLSAVPFEVLSNVVSLVTRSLFSFCMSYRRVHKEVNDHKEMPVLLVLEEAHNYLSREEGAKYRPVKKSIERVAKEGRKYGLSLMIVSQRPAEISETVFSQCSNFVSMRLTNPVDQNYIKRLVPDDISSVTDSISTLGQREALVIGDSVSVPTLIKVNQIQNLPSSSDVEFLTEWRKDWDSDVMNGVIEKMMKN